MRGTGFLAKRGRASGRSELDRALTAGRLPANRLRGPAAAAAESQTCQSESEVTDCRFRDGCDTYGDPLIDRAAKGQHGRGCLAQTDIYRKKHCKAFACKLLCCILREAVAKLGRSRCEPAEASCPERANGGRS